MCLASTTRYAPLNIYIGQDMFFRWHWRSQWLFCSHPFFSCQGCSICKCDCQLHVLGVALPSSVNRSSNTRTRFVRTIASTGHCGYQCWSECMNTVVLRPVPLLCCVEKLKLEDSYMYDFSLVGFSSDCWKWGFLVCIVLCSSGIARVYAKLHHYGWAIWNLWSDHRHYPQKVWEAYKQNSVFICVIALSWHTHICPYIIFYIISMSGDGVLIMSVDNLPAELPSEASSFFGSQLLPYIQYFLTVCLHSVLLLTPFCHCN